MEIIFADDGMAAAGIAFSLLMALVFFYGVHTIYYCWKITK